MSNKKIKERLDILEKRIINLDAKFMGQIAGLRDKHILTNDRITELFDILKMMEKENAYKS
tara:strand:+ start:1570 stop:1752 length:183 start_codon:yes stop_codon:yes gene_type:complete